MAKMMLHDSEAREALGRGVAKLARAVRGALGPKGMNAIVDRPIGTPIVSRDGVSIASEIELEDLGSARQVRISASKTLITAGRGEPKKVNARRGSDDCSGKICPSKRMLLGAT